MDVSDLRKRILRALDDARRESADRRQAVDAASSAYEEFLASVATPLVRQASAVLRAEGHLFAVNTPAGGVRLESERAPQTFLEFELDPGSGRPQIIGRVSLTRGRGGLIVDEQPIAPGKAIVDITEEDVAGFLLTAVRKLVSRT
jgi:hypothetical protein